MSSQKALLTESRNSMDDFDAEYDFRGEKSRRRTHWTSYMLIAVTLALVVSNAAWIWHSSKPTASIVDRPYWASDKVVLKPHHWDTPFTGDNKTETNTLWRNLFPVNQGMVYLPTEWAEAKKLPASMKNSRNTSESTYFVSAYHQLHCLSVVRAAMYHWKEGAEQTVAWEHAIHCLDSVRQSVMCSADDTLLYSEDGQVFGDGQVHQCRDWEALETWILDHDHHELL